MMRHRRTIKLDNFAAMPYYRSMNHKESTIGSNLYDLTARTILALAQSDDTDAAEFGNRMIRMMALAAKHKRTASEQRALDAVTHVLNQGLTDDAMREHLANVLKAVR
jgi:hypothetical protein